MINETPVAILSSPHPAPSGAWVKIVACAALTVIIPVLLLSVLGETVEFARILNDSNTAANKDFVSYWAAGQLLMRHANPYDPDAALALEKSVGYIPTQGVTMRNPPIALPLVLPLGLMAAKQAAFLWSLLIVVCLGAALHLAWLMHGRPRNKVHLLGFAFPAALCCFAAGQTSGFALLGVAGFLYFHKRRPFLAGVAIAACAIKPHLFLVFGAVLVVWALISRAWLLMAGACTALAISLAIPLYFDPALWPEYLRFLKTDGIDRDAIAVLASLLRVATNRNWMWMQFLPAAAGVLWGIWYFRRHRQNWDWPSHGSLLLLVSLVVSPYSWFFDEIILLPAILHAMFASMHQQRAVIGFGVICCAAQIETLMGAPLYSGFYMWTTAAWLAWYVLETAPARQRGVRTLKARIA